MIINRSLMTGVPAGLRRGLTSYHKQVPIPRRLDDVRSRIDAAPTADRRVQVDDEEHLPGDDTPWTIPEQPPKLEHVAWLEFQIETLDALHAEMGRGERDGVDLAQGLFRGSLDAP